MVQSLNVEVVKAKPFCFTWSHGAAGGALTVGSHKLHMAHNTKCCRVASTAQGSFEVCSSCARPARPGLHLYSHTDASSQVGEWVESWATAELGPLESSIAASEWKEFVQWCVQWVKVWEQAIIGTVDNIHPLAYYSDYERAIRDEWAKNASRLQREIRKVLAALRD